LHCRLPIADLHIFFWLPAAAGRLCFPDSKYARGAPRAAENQQIVSPTELRKCQSSHPSTKPFSTK